MGKMKLEDALLKIYSPVFLIVGLVGLTTQATWNSKTLGLMTFLGAVGLVLPTIDKIVKDGN